MKIPKKLKIGGHSFKISSKKMEQMGQTNMSALTIDLDKSLPRSQKESTLIHEIFHCLNTTFGRHSHELMDSLAEQFYQVLSDNKLLK